jgi:hypothetical protein
MSQGAPNHNNREKIIPVAANITSEMRKTRLAPRQSPRATFSATIIEIATGMPAEEMLSASRYIG